MKMEMGQGAQNGLKLQAQNLTPNDLEPETRIRAHKFSAEPATVFVPVARTAESFGANLCHIMWA